MEYIKLHNARPPVIRRNKKKCCQRLFHPRYGLQSTHPLYVAYTNHNRLLQCMSCTAPKMNSLQGWTDGFRGAVRVGFWYVWRCWRMHENHGHSSGRYRLHFQVNSTVNWLVSLGSCPVDSGWFAAVNLSQHNFRWFLAKRMVITNALLLAAPIAVAPNFMTILMMVDTLMDRQCKVMLLLFCSSGVVISSYFANIICNLMRLRSLWFFWHLNSQLADTVDGHGFGLAVCVNWTDFGENWN